MTTSVRGYSQALWPTGEELDGTAYERSQLNGINVRSLVHELRQPLRELRPGADLSKDSAPDQRKLDIRKKSTGKRPRPQSAPDAGRPPEGDPFAFPRGLFCYLFDLCWCHLLTSARTRRGLGRRRTRR